MDSKNEGHVEITDLAILPDYFHPVTVTLIGRPPDQTINIRREPFEDRPDEIEQNPNYIAFCVHSWCYAVLIWKVPKCSISDVYRLVRSLTPKPSIWQYTREELTGLPNQQLDCAGSLRTLAGLADRSLALAPLLSILKLPPEIIILIWEYVGLLTPYSAFLLVAGETSRLAIQLHSPRSCDLMLKPGSYFSAKMMTVFGTQYIQDLHAEDGDINFQVSGTVLGVKLAVSVSGICAIKILGCDWETDWVGKIPSTGRIWYGMINGTVHAIRFNYNVSRCLHPCHNYS